MAGRTSWQVERVIVDQTVNTPAGDTVVGNYVYFVTGQGNHGVVFISNDHFNPKHVAEQIRPAAQKLDEVAQLSEGIG